jgi:hypothetical protein
VSRKPHIVITANRGPVRLQAVQKLSLYGEDFLTQEKRYLEFEGAA